MFVQSAWIYLALAAVSGVSAEPLRAYFTSCSSQSTPSSFVVDTVHADMVTRERADELGLIAGGSKVLRLNVFGAVGEELIGFNNETEKLATLFSTTKTLTFTSHTATTYLCNSLFPANLPEPYGPNVTYCPFPAGPFGLNLSVPLSHKHALTSLSTQVRIVDASVPANELMCINISTTPFYRRSGIYLVFLWVPVAIAAAYWVTCWAARFAAGWVVGSVVVEGHGGQSNPGLGGPHANKVEHGLMRKWGTMMVSGFSGERLSVSGGLLRFVTPGFRDVIFHTQFCCMLGMLAVKWPPLVYPILSQGSWSTLVWNVTLVQGANAIDDRIDILPGNYTPPAQFSEQLSSSTYPLFLPPNEYNPLLDLGNADRGMVSWATAVGLRRQDLFGTCLSIFLMLVAGVLLLSLTIWAGHGLIEYLMGGGATATSHSALPRSSLGASPRSSQGGKDTFDARDKDAEAADGDDGLQVPHQTLRAGSPPSRIQRTWWRFRLKGAAGAFHSSALYGNLVRMIVLFHLPITIFSVYQFTLGKTATLPSRILAAFAFVFISIVIPVGLLFKVAITPSAKLYDATRTLLALAPLYNVYEQGNQLFPALTIGASLVQGVVVGGAQKSGTAQAIILLIVEIAMALITAIVSPWGEGAGMGVPSFILSTLRIVTMVLILILAPAIDMSTPAAGWITYGVLVVQGIVFLFFICMLLSKIVEGFIRLFGKVHFDESTHPLDGGLFAACSSLDCLGGAGGGAAAARRRKKRGSRQYEQNISRVGSLSTQMMLDRHSQHPRSNGADPMLGDYPLTSSTYATPGSVKSPGYFAALQNGSEYPMTPADESADGHIMGAWRTPGGYRPGATREFQQAANSYPPPHHRQPSAEREELLGPDATTPTRGFSVVRGGKADANDPYQAMAPAARPPSAFHTADPQQQPLAPRHTRTKSQTAVIEDFAASDSWANDTMASQNRLPALSLPRHQAESSQAWRAASPSSDYSDDTRRPKHKKRNSKAAAWLTRAPGDDSDASDREQRPRRSGGKRAKSADVERAEPSASESRSWFSSALRTIGGVKDKPLAPAAEQARDENKARKAALLAESGALLAGDSPPATPTSSFKVIRHQKPSASPVASGSSTPKPSTSAAPDSSRSFKVVRPERKVESPLPSPGFVVNRPTRTPAPASFVPLAKPAPTSSFSVSSRPRREP